MLTLPPAFVEVKPAPVATTPAPIAAAPLAGTPDDFGPADDDPIWDVLAGEARYGDLVGAGLMPW